MLHIHLVVSHSHVAGQHLFVVVEFSFLSVLTWVEPSLNIEVVVFTHLLEWKLHLSSDYESVSVLDSHLSKTFGLPGHWLFALNVDVHLFLLDKFSQLGVLDVRQNGLVENFKALVGTDLNLEGLVQTVVKSWSLDEDLETHAPGLLLPVSALGVKASQVVGVLLVILEVVSVGIAHLVHHVLLHLIWHVLLQVLVLNGLAALHLHLYVVELLTAVILKSLVSLQLLIVRVHVHSRMESLHTWLWGNLVGHGWVCDVVLGMLVHLDVLLLLHLHLLLVSIRMHSLGRVKTIVVNLLVELVHLHLLIHIHVGLALHLLVDETLGHRLASVVLGLHLCLLRVLDTLLVWVLHLINSFKILLIKLVISTMII